jgi:hypothetical protein
MIKIGVIKAPPPTPVMPTSMPTAKPDSEKSGSIMQYAYRDLRAALDLSTPACGRHRTRRGNAIFAEPFRAIFQKCAPYIRNQKYTCSFAK